MDPTSYPALLSPLELGPLRLRNRVVHVAMTTNANVGGRVSTPLIDYHRSRARGGAALLITEPIGTVPRHRILPRTQAWNDDDLEGFRRWAAAVTAEGAHLVAQIQDPGRGRHSEGRAPDAIGPSALPDELSGTVPRAMTAGDIAGYVQETARSAQRLQHCGFAGVELSCGHGHLFHQFLSPWMNRRTDEWGGTVPNRCRFVLDLMATIRATCGTGFLIALKLPGDDGLPGSIGPAEAYAIGEHLCATGLPDVASFAWGAHARTLEMHVPDRFGPRLAYMEANRALRPALGPVPLIAIGRITDPAEAEAILQSGDAALIGLGRALIADPAFLAKAASNRAHDIRYCISCNTCWGTIGDLRHTLACVNNPRVTLPDEADFYPQPAPTPRRITIVGAGPAGLETAWVAAARGHHVTVFGNSPEVGGGTRLRALLPGGETITSIPDYQYAKALRHGARFILGRPATPADILETRPDAVILATGAQMIPPDWLQPDMLDAIPSLRAALPPLMRLRTRQPGTAVIIDTDHGEAVYAAALHLQTLFTHTILVTPRDAIAQDLHLMARQGTLRRLAQSGIQIITATAPLWTESALEGTLHLQNVHTGQTSQINDIALLTWATPRTPILDLEPALLAAGVTTHRIGDATVAGDLLAATATGHAAGMFH